MRFSILLLFMLAIGGLILWQNRPVSDPMEEAGQRIIAKMKREAALNDQREAMALDERKLETEKLNRKYPNLLKKCLETAQYKRSNFKVHEFLDKSLIAFCVSGGGINLDKFLGEVYYQPKPDDPPQVLNFQEVADGEVGFETKPVAINLNTDGFTADRPIFFRNAMVPAFRRTFNCSMVTYECASEKRETCALNKKEREDEAYISQYRLTANELMRVDDEDKELYEQYFEALSGNRKAEKALLTVPKGTPLAEKMQVELKRYRRAGCL